VLGWSGYVWDGAAVSSAALPFAGLASAWPEDTWNPVIVSSASALAVFCTYICCFYFLYHRQATPEQINKYLKWAIALTITFAVLHLFLFLRFTYHVPTRVFWYRKVIGLVYTDKGATLSAAGASDFQLLQGDGFNAKECWQPWSVDLMRGTIFVVWLALVICFTAFVSDFVISQIRKAEERPPTPSRTRAPKHEGQANIPSTDSTPPQG
jgi:hypothetical protein